MNNAISSPGARAPRWFEDYPQGLTETLGSFDVDPQEVQAFARRYDPQPFHIDEQAAREGPYGGIIASGWHTASMMMRLLVDGYLHPASSMGSPGIDELRWVRPVRPGDRLTVRVTVKSARRSASKPDRGIIQTFFEVTEANNQVVMHMTAMNLIRCRPGDAKGPQAS
jgi:acyl dehydratase